MSVSPPAVKFGPAVVTLFESGGRMEKERRSLDGRRGVYTITEIYTRSHSKPSGWKVRLDGELLGVGGTSLREVKAVVNRHDNLTPAEQVEAKQKYDAFLSRNAVRAKISRLDVLSRNGFDMNAATMSAFLADLDDLILKYARPTKENSDAPSNRTE